MEWGGGKSREKDENKSGRETVYIGEQDMDNDKDDDHDNNIGESYTVYGDEVSAAHSC